MFVHTGPFDLFTNPKEELRKSFEELVTTVMSLIARPPQLDMSSGWDKYLFGNFWGLAQYISITVAMVLIVITTVWRDKALIAVKAVGVMIVVAGFGKIFYVGAMMLSDLGDQFSRGSLLYLSHGRPTAGMGMPVLDDFYIGLFAYFIGFCLSWAIIGELVAFMLAKIFVVTMGIFIFAFILAGRTGEKLWRWTVSIALVSMLWGRPSMGLWISLGQWLSDFMPGGNLLVVSAFLVLMCMLAAILTPVALVVASALVISKLQGGKSKSHVDGEVNTREQGKHEVLLRDADSTHRRGFDLQDSPKPSAPKQSTSVPASATPASPSTTQAIGDVAKQAAVTKVAAATTGGAAPVVIAAVSMADAAKKEGQ